jgi:hypothetical protein
MSHNSRLLHLFGLTKEAASMGFVRQVLGQSGGVKAITSAERKALAGNISKQIRATNPGISPEDLTRQVREQMSKVAPKSGPGSHVVASRSDKKILEIRKAKSEASREINKLRNELSQHVNDLKNSGLSDKDILKDETHRAISKRVQKLKNQLNAHTQNESNRMSELKADLQEGKSGAKSKLKESIERARESKKLEQSNLANKANLQGLSESELNAKIQELENQMGTKGKKFDKVLESRIKQIEGLKSEAQQGVDRSGARQTALDRLSGKNKIKTLDQANERSLIRGSEEASLQGGRINSTGVQNQYNAMIKSKSFISNSESAIKRSPELAREYSEHVRRFGKTSPQEFMAQKNIQQQMRIGARGGKTRLDSQGRPISDGQFLDSSQGLISTNAQRAGKIRGQDVQLNRAKLEMSQGKASDEAAFKRYNAMSPEDQNRVNSRLGISSAPTDANSFAINRNVKSIEDKLHRDASPIAQRYMKGNKSLDQDAAMEMAKKDIRSRKGYIDNPMSGQQRAEYRAFGNATPVAGNSLQDPKNTVFSGNISDPNSLKFDDLKYTQKRNLTNQDPYSVLSSTSKDKVKSKKSNNASNKGGKSNNGSDDNQSFMSQYGLPLAGGAGLIGAGMLYSSSKSNQNNQPMSNGV